MNPLGKTVRLNADGSVPQDNPFVGREDALPEIYTYGHRNSQGLFFDSETGNLYLTEHGPQGGDELNNLLPGKNFGWPIATYGLDYSGARISPFTEYPGTEQPMTHWSPSIAPGDVIRYRGEMFPEWEGDFLIGGLAIRQLARVDMEGEDAGGQFAHLTEQDRRIRDVEIAPDGSLWVLTEHPRGNDGLLGELWRVYR